MNRKKSLFTCGSVCNFVEKQDKKDRIMQSLKSHVYIYLAGLLGDFDTPPPQQYTQ